MAMDFQIIQTSRKSFDNWRDPPIRKTLAKSDTTDTTNAGPGKRIRNDVQKICNISFCKLWLVKWHL